MCNTGVQLYTYVVQLYTQLLRLEIKHLAMIVDGSKHYGDVLVSSGNYTDFLSLCDRYSVSGKYVIDSYSITISDYKNPILVTNSSTKNSVIGAFRLRYPAAKIVFVDADF